jgi:hypothetical protein
VDNYLKMIKWNTSQYTPTAGLVVIINYSFYRQIVVHVDDAASIISHSPAGSPQPKEIVLTKLDIDNYQDAETYALQFLADHKDDVLKTTLKITNVKDTQVGQSVRVIESYNAVDQYFTVVRVKKVFPYRYDEVEVVSRFIDEGLYAWNIQQRIKRLEEQQQGDSDTVGEVKSVTEYVDLLEMFEIEVNGSSWLKRDWRFYDYSELSAGSTSGNVDIVNGDIRFI